MNTPYEVDTPQSVHIDPGAKKRSANDFPSLPARSIKDLSIPEDAMKIDNELAKRSDEASMDLAKWALLGIAGYGFLLKEMAVPNNAALLACQKYAVLLFLGASFLAGAAACALASKERLIRCSVYQMNILRTLNKLDIGGWSQHEARLLQRDLSNYRTSQKKNIVIASTCLRLAHIFLATGAVVTVICFGLVIFSMHSPAGGDVGKPTPTALVS